LGDPICENWYVRSATDTEDALAHLPTKPHRAFFRLLADGIVARHHLHDEEPSSWLSFLAVGETGTCKSLLAFGACNMFGLDPVRAILSVPAETERSFWGRRYQVAGGTWKLRPAPVLSYPFLGLDELDKASPPTQRACLKLLQGETRVRGEEGELVEVTPTVMVLSNSSVSLIPPEYRRRSLTLDTRPLADQLAGLDLDRTAQCFLDALTVLDLDALEFPSQPVPEAEFAEMRRALRAGLSEVGWRMSDRRALVHLVPGRMALSGLGVREAAMAVVSDYLDVAETVCETVQAPGPLEPAPNAEERRKAAEAEAARERAARKHDRAEEDELEGAIGEALDELERLIPNPADYDEHQRAVAARVNKQLKSLIEQVDDAGTLDELAEVIEDRQPVITNARILQTMRSPEPSSPPTPARDDVIDVEEVKNDYEGWWCNECDKCFDEPHRSLFSFYDQCPSCWSCEIEWGIKPAPPEPLVAQVEPSGAEILEQQWRTQMAEAITAAVRTPPRRALLQPQHPAGPFEGLRAFLSMPGAIMRQREARTSKQRN
jgi:hypothetical protein